MTHPIITNSISSLIAEEYTHAFIYVSVIISSQIIMVNMILCITILCNNVLFYHYRVSREDGSMPGDKPVNVL